MGVDTWPWTLEDNSIEEKAPAGAPMKLRDVIGRPIRVVAPDEQVNGDYVPGRVTFYLNEAGKVKKIIVEKPL